MRCCICSEAYQLAKNVKRKGLIQFNNNSLNPIAIEWESSVEIPPGVTYVYFPIADSSLVRMGVVYGKEGEKSTAWVDVSSWQAIEFANEMKLTPVTWGKLNENKMIENATINPISLLSLTRVTVPGGSSSSATLTTAHKKYMGLHILKTGQHFRLQPGQTVSYDDYYGAQLMR